MILDLRLPELGENITSADVVAVRVAPDDCVVRDQPLIEVETEKAAVEIPSPRDGRVKEIRVKPGDKLGIGQVFMLLEVSGSDAPAVEKTRVPEAGMASSLAAMAPAPAAMPPRPPSSTAATEPAPASPSVRRLARELGIDIHHVRGSGPAGRLSKEDVKEFARRLIGQAQTGAGLGGAAVALPPLPDFSRWGAVERQPMTRIRATIARNMAVAWTTIPHVTHHMAADITEVEALRREWSARVEAGGGGKLTVTAILLKVTASALRHFPKLNASLDLAAEQIVFKHYVHIGVAVDTDRGLMVPVIRDVDRKNILEISRELKEVSERARNRKLALEEMQGGNFSLTNLGGIGVQYFTPIVNWPEVAVLGVGRTWKEGDRIRLPLSLSYDHRLVDGADAARFQSWVVEALDRPLLLALEG